MDFLYFIFLFLFGFFYTMFVLLLQQEETLKICKKKRKNTPENRSHSSILFPPSFFACFENAQGGHHPGHQSNDRAGRAGEGQVSSASSVPALHILCNSGDPGDLCHGPGRPQRTDRSSGIVSHPKSNLNLWPSTNTYISLCLCFPPYTSFLVGRVPGRKKARERCLAPPGQESPWAAPASHKLQGGWEDGNAISWGQPGS